MTVDEGESLERGAEIMGEKSEKGVMDGVARCR